MGGGFDRLAEFALGMPQGAIPEPAMRAAALHLLDTAGIAAAATPMQAGRIARDAAVALISSADPKLQARIAFDGRAASPPGAAFAMASAIDNLDGHDGYNPSKGHIGVVVLPALVCLAQLRPDLGGRDALAAAVVGYEVAGRAATALHASVSDYHTSGAWNALGVVAMAVRVLDHDREVLRHGLGIAEYHGPRSQMMREIANPTMLHDGSGMGALVGMMAAHMAAMGFTGAPAITIEAPEAAAHWQDLGRNWQVTRQYVKPYPICRWAHAAIDAVRAIVLDHDLRLGDIDRIQLRTFHEAACLFGGMPETTSQAQYSLRFALAAWLVHGGIGLDQISGAGLSDPQVAKVMSRIDIAEDDEFSSRFPRDRMAAAEIRLADGQSLSSGPVHARGGPEAPMPESEIVEKFHEFANPVLGRDRADRLRQAILTLLDPAARAGDLLPLLLPPV